MNINQNTVIYGFLFQTDVVESLQINVGNLNQLGICWHTSFLLRRGTLITHSCCKPQSAPSNQTRFERDCTSLVKEWNLTLVWKLFFFFFVQVNLSSLSLSCWSCCCYCCCLAHHSSKAVYKVPSLLNSQMYRKQLPKPHHQHATVCLCTRFSLRAYVLLLPSRYRYKPFFHKGK